MASNIKLSATLRNAMLDAITTTMGTSALLRIYDGTQPAGPATAITSQVLLAELTCSASAFATAASSGVLTLNSITADSSANATGTAAWARWLTSGATAHIDCTVGTSGCDINLSSVSIVITGSVSITSATITAGNS